MTSSEKLPVAHANLKSCLETLICDIARQAGVLSLVLPRQRPPATVPTLLKDCATQ
jgi:hypothetical protein